MFTAGDLPVHDLMHTDVSLIIYNQRLTNTKYKKKYLC